MPASKLPMSAGSATALSSTKPSGRAAGSSTTVKPLFCMSGTVRLSPACSVNPALPLPSSASCSWLEVPFCRRVTVRVWPALPGTVSVKAKLCPAGTVSPASAVTVLAMVRLAGAASARRPLLPW